MTGVLFTPVDYGFGPSAIAVRDASVPTATTYSWCGYFRVITLPPYLSPVFAGRWFSFGDAYEGLEVDGSGNVSAAGFNSGGGSFAITLNTTYATTIRRSGDDFDVRVKPDGGSWTTVYSANTSQTGRPAWDWLGSDTGNYAWEGGVWLSRFWNGSALSDAEFDAELGSLTPVRTADLWADWQMVTGALYDDSSGNTRGLNNQLNTSDWGTSDLPLVYSAPSFAVDALQFLVEVRPVVVSALPGSPTVGDFVVLSTDGSPRCYDGSEWLGPGLTLPQILARRFGGC